LSEGKEEEHEEEQTESKAYTNGKCVLEELFDRAGHEIVTFISKAGSEALLNGESLDCFLTEVGISRSQMEKTEGAQKRAASCTAIVLGRKQQGLRNVHFL